MAKQILDYPKDELLRLAIEDASRRTGVPVEKLMGRVADSGHAHVEHREHIDLVVPDPATSFKMIRAGAGYNPVILVTPADTEPYAPGSKYYEYSSIKDDNSIPGWKVGEFNEISHEETHYAFYPMADGWGFAELPEVPFLSIEAALAFVKAQHS